MTVLGAACVFLLTGIISKADQAQSPAIPFHTGDSSQTPARYMTISQGHWMKGDAEFDADTQVKLIALTNAYYDTDDNDERYLISVKANEIRDTAGTVSDDSLVDSSKVLPLGMSLEDAVTNGELTKAQLLELEKPYVQISEPETDPQGRTVSIYTFGQVDVELIKYADATIFSSESKLIENVMLTVSAHYGVYFFYNPGWEGDCRDAVGAFAASGIPESDIGTVSLTSYEKFIDAWNSINLTSTGFGVPYVFIDTEATPTELNGPDYRFFTSAISQLQDKRIDHLILLGCSAGHLDFAETNPAAAFARKIYGGYVLASDGTVYTNGTDETGALQYESRNDDLFQLYKGTDGRENAGWVVYRSDSGEISTYDAAATTFTIPEITDYFETTS
jgi:hypothetical protein